MPFGLGLFDQQLKLASRTKLENLTEHATESIHVEPPALGVVELTLLELPNYKPKEAQLLNLNLDKSALDYWICHCCGELNQRVPNLRLKEVSNGLGKN